MDIQCFIDILSHHISKEQIDVILEEIHEAQDENDEGRCPICGCNCIAVDADGNTVEEDSKDWVAYRAQHSDDCPEVLLTIRSRMLAVKA